MTFVELLWVIDVGVREIMTWVAAPASKFNVEVPHDVVPFSAETVSDPEVSFPMYTVSEPTPLGKFTLIVDIPVGPFGVVEKKPFPVSLSTSVKGVLLVVKLPPESSS